jgi:hypothetical protein
VRFESETHGSCNVALIDTAPKWTWLNVLQSGLWERFRVTIPMMPSVQRTQLIINHTVVCGDQASLFVWLSACLWCDPVNVTMIVSTGAHNHDGRGVVTFMAFRNEQAELGCDSAKQLTRLVHVAWYA